MKKLLALLAVFSLCVPAHAGGTWGGGGATYTAGTDFAPPMAVNAYTSGPNSLTTAMCGEVIVNTSGTNTYNLPATATLINAFSACELTFRTHSGTITIDTPGAETINDLNGVSASITLNPAIFPGSVTLVYDSVNTVWQAFGRTSSATTGIQGVASYATDAQVRTGTATSTIPTPGSIAKTYGTKGADIASGAPAILVDGNTADLTGTTAVTSLGTPATAPPSGFVYRLKSEGAIKYVHNATSLILSGGKDLLTFDGDSVSFQYEGSGNWRMIGISRASGAPADPAPIKSVYTKAYSGWDVTGFGGTATDGAAGSNTGTASASHPGGVNVMSTGTSATGYATSGLNGSNKFVVGTDPIVAESGFNIATLADGTEDYDAFIGLSDAYDIRAKVDSIGIYYDRDTNTDWLIQACNDSVCTSTDSNVPVATGNKRLTMVINAAGTSVEFFLDSVSMGVVTTNIPTGTGDAMDHLAGIDKEAGTTARTMDVNFFGFTQYLTTPR